MRGNDKKPLPVESCIPKNIIFGAALKSKHVKTFVSIIKAMNFVNNTEIQLFDQGFKYVAEESKSFQAKACLRKDFFNDYLIKLEDDDDEIPGFGVNLNSFTDLLTALLDNGLSNMRITYYQKENLICFAIQQTDSGDTGANKGGMHSTCGDEIQEPAGEIVNEYFIKTMHSIDPIDFNIDDPHLLNNIIFDASDLLSILQDFEKSIEEVEVKITASRLTIKAVGLVQYGCVCKVSHDSEVFIKYESEAPSKFIYKFKYLKVMMKALSLSSKVSLVTHVNGMMKIQLMVKTEDEEEPSAHIEYNIIPTLPETDSEPDV